MNTCSHEHHRSHITLCEHLVEIVQYVKRELMYYTRRKKDGNPSISFDDGDGKHRVVKLESTVRWLRVYFN